MGLKKLLTFICTSLIFIELFSQDKTPEGSAFKVTRGVEITSVSSEYLELPVSILKPNTIPGDIRSW